MFINPLKDKGDKQVVIKRIPSFKVKLKNKTPNFLLDTKTLMVTLITQEDCQTIRLTMADTNL